VVVASDVAHDLSPQVRDGREYAARDDVALDLGEPDFDLVQPRGVGRREVQVDVAMSIQELLHSASLVRREVVEDHVDLSPSGLRSDQLREEGDELIAGVALNGLAVDLSAERVERGVERQGAVTVVLEPMSLETSRTEGQDRIEAVQRLDYGSSRRG
jgi:hypothetical protein